MNHTIEKNFEILLHDTDHTRAARLTALCNYLQATADFHSRSLGTSMVHLEEKNLTWVYARFRIEIQHYPECYDTVTVKTWRSRMEGPLGFREFEIKNLAGSTVGTATSTVALIDRGTRKPVAIPEEFSSQFSDLPGRALGGDFGQLPDVAEETSSKKIFPVLMRDIDLNGHVNNVSYISWVLESSPEEILKNFRCHTLEIQYRAEAFYGKPMKAKTAMREAPPSKEIILNHVLSQGENLTTRACTTWIPFQD